MIFDFDSNFMYSMQRIMYLVGTEKGLKENSEYIIEYEELEQGGYIKTILFEEKPVMKLVNDNKTIKLYA